MKPWRFSLQTVSHGWAWAERLIYVGIGLTLLVTAVGGLGETWRTYVLPWMQGQQPLNVLEILDQLLLISMLVEILQMVKISLTTQLRLASEPFLTVGLISVVRRVLIITAEGSRIITQTEPARFLALMAELGILALLVAVFVYGLYRLRQQRFEELRRLRDKSEALVGVVRHQEETLFPCGGNAHALVAGVGTDNCP